MPTARRWRRCSAGAIGSGSRGNHDPDPADGIGGSFAEALALGAPSVTLASRCRSCAALQRGRDWIWIAGNHDPDPAGGIGGALRRDARDRRADLPPSNRPARDGEIAGHLHPVARVARRGRAVSRRCFAGDGRRLVMPAFGAYAGGLNVRDRAFAGVFGTLAFTAHMLGEGRLYAVAAARCLSD